MDAPFNRHGGLTLVPMPGFMPHAQKAKEKILAISEKDGHIRTPVDIVEPEFGARPSGEPFVRLEKDHIGGHDCVIVTSGPGTPEMLVRLQFLLGYLVGRRAERIALISGYFPLSRSDKDEGLKEFAMVHMVTNMLVAASYGKLDRIVSADLHAAQIVNAEKPGLITEVSLVRRLLSRAVSYAKPLGDRVVLLFSDDGSVKRAEAAISIVQDKMEITLGVVAGTKRRNAAGTSKLGTMYGDLELLEGSTAVSVDDEFSTGGTGMDVARAVKTKYRAKRVLATTTHGVICGEASKRLADPESPIEKLIVSDTIPIDNRPELGDLVQRGILDVQSWTEDLGWIIYQHHWDKSIREMR